MKMSEEQMRIGCAEALAGSVPALRWPLEGGSMSDKMYQHPTTIESFEQVYDQEYNHEIESCDRWIKWATEQNDYYGVTFHQGMRSALVFNDIKMRQLLRVLKQEHPNKS